MAFSPKQLRRFMSLWPPFLGAGIRVREFAADGSRVVVTHRANRLTKNAVGTAFGGTILAMTDPFYMLASMAHLGREYNVWDAAAEVRFIKPGRGTITADMRIDAETYALIRRNTPANQKYLHWFEVEVTDEDGDVVASVRRQVYYRLKRR